MNKPPYFPMYVHDFAADRNVEAMTTEQVGAYTLLLCKAWKEEPAGTIPDNDALLARWTRLAPKKWLAIKAGVLAAFTLEADGRHHQKRMKAEFAKLIGILESRSNAGRISASKRSTNGQQSSNKKSTQRQQTLSDSDSKSDSDSSSSSEQSEWFEKFWADYPRKESKQKAAAAWKKLNPDTDTIGAILAGLKAWSGSRQWLDGVIPHATTWLNGRRWEDEIRPGAGRTMTTAPTFDGIDEGVRRVKEALATRGEL